MTKFKTYKKGSELYNKYINDFIDKFILSFGDIYKRELLYNELTRNISSFKEMICEDDELAFKSMGGYLAGQYNSLFKSIKFNSTLRVTLIHEMLHALSKKGFAKRIPLGKVIFNFKDTLKLKYLDEGLTEYFATTICGGAVEQVRFGGYLDVTNIINHLSKVYGNKVLFDYYFGINDNLIKLINKDKPKNFKKLINLISKNSKYDFHVDPFENIKYYGKNKEVCESSFLVDLFYKKRMKDVKTIEDFKSNLHELFRYYESDIYTCCYNISFEKESLDEGRSKTDNRYKKAELKAKDGFEYLDSLIRKEWNKLNIKDEKLYNYLVLEEIKKFKEEAVPNLLKYTSYEKLYEIELKKEQLVGYKKELEKTLSQNVNYQQQRDDVILSNEVVEREEYKPKM